MIFIKSPNLFLIKQFETEKYVTPKQNQFVTIDILAKKKTVLASKILICFYYYTLLL